MQGPYILTISHSFPQQGKPSYCTLQASRKEKKIIFKSFLHANKGLFFPSFLFILLRFKSYQILYISVSLTVSCNTLLSYSICL